MCYCHQVYFFLRALAQCWTSSTCSNTQTSLSAKETGSKVAAAHCWPATKNVIRQQQGEELSFLRLRRPNKTFWNLLKKQRGGGVIRQFASWTRPHPERALGLHWCKGGITAQTKTLLSDMKCPSVQITAGRCALPSININVQTDTGNMQSL